MHSKHFAVHEVFNYSWLQTLLIFLIYSSQLALIHPGTLFPIFLMPARSYPGVSRLATRSSSLLLGRQSSLNRGQSHDPLVPGPEVGILGLGDQRFGLALKDPRDEVVPGEEGNVDVGTGFGGEEGNLVSIFINM